MSRTNYIGNFTDFKYSYSNFSNWQLFEKWAKMETFKLKYKTMGEHSNITWKIEFIPAKIFFRIKKSFLLFVHFKTENYQQAWMQLCRVSVTQSQSSTLIWMPTLLQASKRVIMLKVKKSPGVSVTSRDDRQVNNFSIILWTSWRNHL